MATEVSKSGVEAARWNIEANKVGLEVACAHKQKEGKQCMLNTYTPHAPCTHTHVHTPTQVDNIFVARMSSEEFTEAWKTQAAKRRLEGLDWAQLSLRTVLVDPPRAGLDPEVCCYGLL